MSNPTATPRPWLNELLRRKGWSQADLAEKIEASRPVVNQWISGVRRPGLEQIFKLEQHLGAEVVERFRAEAGADIAS